MRFAPPKVRPAEVRSAEVHAAEVRLSEVRIAEVRKSRFAPVRSALVRSAPLRCAPWSSASRRSAPRRRAPRRSASVRFGFSRKFAFRHSFQTSAPCFKISIAFSSATAANILARRNIKTACHQSPFPITASRTQPKHRRLNTGRRSGRARVPAIPRIVGATGRGPAGESSPRRF